MLCSKHFESTCFIEKKLFKTAVPSVQCHKDKTISNIPDQPDPVAGPSRIDLPLTDHNVNITLTNSAMFVCESSKQEERKLEVCIDSLESAKNAIQGGADELEVCSSLAEGGLTPSPGLVKEIMRLVVKKAETLTNNQNTKVNVMIRCRGGSDFCYTNNEMETMLADIEIYRDFGIDRFVFGALTKEQEIDKENCMKVLNTANPIPVTFHRAFDLCKKPEVAINDIIGLGFNRILTSGQKPSAADETALQLLDLLFKKYNDKIEIMPGAGVNCDNVNLFVKSGFSIIHSSCKKIKQLPDVGGDLNMGSKEMYVTDENIVKKIKQCMKIK